MSLSSLCAVADIREYLLRRARYTVSKFINVSRDTPILSFLSLLDIPGPALKVESWTLWVGRVPPAPNSASAPSVVESSKMAGFPCCSVLFCCVLSVLLEFLV